MANPKQKKKVLLKGGMDDSTLYRTGNKENNKWASSARFMVEKS